MHPPATAPRHFEPGDVIGGKYQLVARLGQGAMGEVWEAEHRSLRSRVALKLVDTAARPNPAEVTARFLQEARASARVQSPYVVRISDHGEDGAAVYLAMELLRGQGLDARLKEKRKLDAAETTLILAQAAIGIDAAHAEGIVHRDLKPANVFLVEARTGTGEVARETVRVLDFGIAKTLSQSDEPLVATKAGFVLGTPVYMSPEQVVGGKVDGRSDVWQIGVLAFECLVGKLPFPGTVLGDLFVRICTAPLPVPTQVDPSLPPAVDGWFHKACARDPRDRFAGAVEAVTALAAVLGTQAELGVVGLVPVFVASRPARAKRRNPLALGVTLGALLGIAVVIGVIATRPPRAPAARPTPSASAEAPPRTSAPAPAPEPPKATAPPESASAAPAPAASSAPTPAKRHVPSKKAPRPEDEIGI